LCWSAICKTVIVPDEVSEGDSSLIQTLPQKNLRNPRNQREKKNDGN